MPDFDPNEYLKKQSQPKGFDPNKYLEENPIEKKNPTENDSPIGTQTSKRGFEPFQSPVDTKTPSVLTPKGQAEYQEQVKDYVPPKEVKQPKEEVPDFYESVKNSLSNIGTGVQQFIPNTAIALSETLQGLLGKDLGSDFYRNIVGAANNPELDRQEAYAKLAELEPQFKKTRGLIESAEKFDVVGLAAATVDAMSSLVRTAITSVPTAGIGLASDMVGGSIASYNKEKAKSKGISVDELYKRGENEFAIPATIGAIGTGLEAIGLKGTIGLINKKLTGSIAKKFATTFVDVNKEGLTEFTQTGLDAANNALAQGKSATEATKIAVDEMFSKKGLESYLMGAVGSAGASGLGRVAKGMLPANKKTVTEATQKISEMESELSNPNISPATQEFIAENIRENISVIADAIESDADNVEGLSDEQKFTINSVNEVINSYEEVLSDPNASEQTKKLAQERIAKLDLEVDNILEGKKVSTETKGLIESKVQPTEVEQIVEPTQEAPKAEGSGVVGDLVELQNGNKLEINKERSNLNEYSYDVKDSNGNNLGVFNISDNGEYYQIKNVELKNKRTGLGTEIYETIIQKLDKPLYSDPSLTDASKALWEKLVSKGIAEKYTEKIDVNTDKTKKSFNRDRYRTISTQEAEVTPNEVKSEKPIVSEEAVSENIKQTPTQQVEQLRAYEQAEYDAMADQKDKVERQKIYDKYDKLITPLLSKKETKPQEDATQTRKVEQGNIPKREGVTEQQQGKQEDRNNQEEPISKAEAKTSGSDSVVESREKQEVTAQEKDTISLPPRIQGGTPQNFVFSEGEWKQKIGKDLTEISKGQQKQVNDAFVGSQAVAETPKQEAPKAEAPKVEEVVKDEMAEMEEMFAQLSTPPTENQGVSATSKSAIDNLKTNTKDNARVKVIEAAQKLIKTLKSVFPNMDIFIHDNEGSYNAAMAMPNVLGVSDSAGNFSYIKQNDGSITGRIDINLSKANARTVAHEVAHAIMLKAFGENPALFKNFRDRISKVLSDSSNKELMDFADQYEGEVTYEEYLVELTAMLSDQKGKISPTTLQKIAEVINDIVSKLTNGTFKPFEDIKDTNDVINFFRSIAESISKGEEIKIQDRSGEVGVFNIPKSKSQIKAPKASEDKRDFIRKLVQDVDFREFNGKPFVTNMYDYTTAGVAELGNGFKINMLGGKNYVPYMMSLQGKKIGDVSNLAAFNTKSQAEGFKRNSEKGNANLFAPHAGTLSESWQFQQHTFAELVDLVLDSGILKKSELINTFNNTIENSKSNKKAFQALVNKYKNNISDFNSFVSDPKKIVELLDVKNNFSPNLRKALNNSIASNKTFQKALGIKNKQDFYNSIKDPLNENIIGGEIIGLVDFDPKTFEIVQTKVGDIDHHPSFGWTLKAKINGIYQPTEFYKSVEVTDSYTKYNKTGAVVANKEDSTNFEKKNVSSSAGSIPKIAEFKEPVLKAKVVDDKIEAVRKLEAEAANRVKELGDALGFKLGKPVSKSQLSNKPLPVNTTVTNGFDTLKKKFGETAAKAIRENIPFALDYPTEFAEFITKKIPVKEDIAFVVKNLSQRLDGLFRLESDKNIETVNVKNKTPEELSKEAGYVFHRPESENDILAFKKDFENGEVLCTYNDVEGRMQGHFIFWLRRNDAESVLPAKKITQEYLKGNSEGSSLWRGYLGAKGLKLVDGSYDLSNLTASRQDPYGTSSMSVQIGRRGGNISIKNRYNHTVNNPDATFGNDLNTIIDGLNDAVFGIEGVPKAGSQELRLPDNITSDSQGRFFKYDSELENIYVSQHGYVNDGEITLIDKSYQRMIDDYVFDSKSNTIQSVTMSMSIIKDISNINFEKNKITVDSKDGKFEFELVNGILNKLESNSEIINSGFLRYNNSLESVSLPNVRKINDEFLYLNKKIESISLPNVEYIGDAFLRNNTILNSISLPKVKEIGVNFLYRNKELESISLPKIEDIGQFFIYHNENLKSISLPNVKNISDDFLYHNYKLRNISLPNVEKIGGGFLFYNTSLNSISLPNVEKIGSSFLPMNKLLESISLPRVKSIGSSFIGNNDYLNTIDLPNVEEVNSDFLRNNYSLKSISLPSVRYIENNFLMSNKRLESISLPKVEKIGSQFLYYNNSLKTISLPKIEKIGDYFMINNESVERPINTWAQPTSKSQLSPSIVQLIAQFRDKGISDAKIEEFLKGKGYKADEIQSAMGGKTATKPVEKAEQPKPTELIESADEEVSGIKKALVSDEIIESVNLDKISDKAMNELGKKLVETGEIKPDNIVLSIAKGTPRALQPKEVVALIYYKTTLDNKRRELLSEYNKKVKNGESVADVAIELDKVQTDIELYDVMAVITANQQSLAFRLRKSLRDKDYNLVTQIEQYKKDNGGVIPADVEAKFRELDKQLTELKDKLKEAEQRAIEAEEATSVKNIVEDVERSKATTKKASLTPQEKARKKELAKKYNVFNDATRILTILAEKDFREYAKLIFKEAKGDFVEFGRELIKTVGNDIKQFLPKLYEELGGKGKANVSELTPQPFVKDGELVIPPAFIRDAVEQGNTDINTLAEAVKKIVEGDLPNITIRAVRDAITRYGKTVNQTKDIVQQQINEAKRLGRLYSELEDLQNKKAKEKSGKVFNKISDKEREVKRKIRILERAIPPTPEALEQTELQRSNARKEYLKRFIQEKKDRLDKGNFAPKPKATPVRKDSEIIALETEANKIRDEYDAAHYENKQANRSGWEKFKDTAMEWGTGVSRALVAGLDFGFFLVQGIVSVGSTNPLKTLYAINQSLLAGLGTNANPITETRRYFRELGSEKVEREQLANLKAQPYYPIMKASGLSIQEPNAKLGERDDALQASVINKIWDFAMLPIKYINPKAYEVAVKANPYRAGERAYTGASNAIRVQMFLDFAIALEKKGITFEDSPELYKIAANTANNMTFRGRLRFAEPIAAQLNMLYFSSRKVTASLSLVNPAYWVDLGVRNPIVAKQALLKMATFIGVATSVTLALQAFSDDDDEEQNPDMFNPYSSDFMTYRIGNTRLNFFGGLGGNLVLFARFLTGNYKTTSSSKIKKLGQDSFTPNRKELLETTLFANKLNPMAGTGYAFLNQSIGREIDWEDEAISSVSPLWAQNISELQREHPYVMASFLSYMSFLGQSINTYGTPEFIDREKDKELFDLIQMKNASFKEITRSNVDVLDINTGEKRDITRDEFKVFQKEYGDYIKNHLKLNYKELSKMPVEKFEREINNLKTRATKYAKEIISGITPDMLTIEDKDKTYELTPAQIKERKALNKEYIDEFGDDIIEAQTEIAIEEGKLPQEAKIIAEKKLKSLANANSKIELLEKYTDDNDNITLKIKE
jgi:hypothetical protein